MLEDGKLIAQGPYSQVAVSLAHIKTTNKQTEDILGEDDTAMDQVSEDAASEESKRPFTEETEEISHELQLLRQKGSWSVYTYYFKVSAYLLLKKFRFRFSTLIFMLT